MRPPKGTSLRGNASYDEAVVTIGPLVLLGASQRIKQKNILKVYEETEHVTCHVFTQKPPTLPQRHINLHVWSHPRRSYIFQVSSKSIQVFSRRLARYGQVIVDCKLYQRVARK